MSQTVENPYVVEMSADELSLLERHTENEIKKLTFLQNLKLSAQSVRIILICIVVIIALYVLDLVLVNVGMQNSALHRYVFELLRLISTTLLGYAFAKGKS